jgi:hypothetical protein
MKIYQDLFITGMPIAILVVFVCSNIFKKLNTKQAIKWIRIILILGGVLSIMSFLYYTILDNENTFPDRLSGPYAFTYLFMLVSGTLMPFILLYKKAGRNIWILFVVSMMMNIGRIMESVIISISSLHGDFGTFCAPIGIKTVLSGLFLGAAIIFLQFIFQKNVLPHNHGSE